MRLLQREYIQGGRVRVKKKNKAYDLNQFNYLKIYIYINWTP